MRPSATWKDENIIDLTAEAVDALDAHEQYEHPTKDLVRIRQAVQSETSYPGQPESGPPGRTETGPGRLTFQRRAQVPAGEEERRAGHERGDHVYEKMSQKGELPSWLKTLAAAPSRETRANIEEERARPPPIDLEFRPPNFDPLSPHVVAPDHWRNHKNERSRHDRERDPAEYFAAEADPPRRVRIFDDELPLSEQFRAEVDDSHRSPSTGRRQEARHDGSSRKRDRERGRRHEEDRTRRREQHSSRKYHRSRRGHRARSRGRGSSGSSNDERYEREGGDSYFAMETAGMRRQPGALASGAVLVSNRRLSGERPSGLVQNLEHMAELRYSPLTSQSPPKMIPFGSPVPPPSHRKLRGQPGQLRIVPFAPPPIIPPAQVVLSSPPILPFSHAAPQTSRALANGAPGPASAVPARMIPFSMLNLPNQQGSPANVSNFRFAPHQVGPQIEPKQPAGLVTGNIPAHDSTNDMTAMAPVSRYLPAARPGLHPAGGMPTYTSGQPMQYPLLDSRRQMQPPPQIQMASYVRNRDQLQVYPTQTQTRLQIIPEQFHLPNMALPGYANDSRPPPLVRAAPVTLPATSGARFATGMSSPLSYSTSANTAAPGRLPLTSQAIMQQDQQSGLHAKGAQIGSDGIDWSAQETATGRGGMTFASASGSSVSAPRTPGHTAGFHPARLAHENAPSHFQTPARKSTRLPGRLSLPTFGPNKLAATASADEINTSIVVGSSQAKKLQQQLNKMSANRSALGKSVSHSLLGTAPAAIGESTFTRVGKKTIQQGLPSSGSSHRFSDGIEVTAGGSR